jgi:hypothetical protein
MSVAHVGGYAGAAPSGADVNTYISREVRDIQDRSKDMNNANTTTTNQIYRLVEKALLSELHKSMHLKNALYAVAKPHGIIEIRYKGLNVSTKNPRLEAMYPAPTLPDKVNVQLKDARFWIAERHLKGVHHSVAFGSVCFRAACSLGSRKESQRQRSCWPHVGIFCCPPYNPAHNLRDAPRGDQLVMKVHHDVMQLLRRICI